MCQLDRSMGCPDIGSNIIQRLLGRVFLDEMNVWIHRLSKADCLPKGSWSLCSWLKSWTEQKGASSDCLDWNIRLKADTSLSWVSSLQGLRGERTAVALLGLQLCGPQIWGLLRLHKRVNQFLPGLQLVDRRSEDSADSASVWTNSSWWIAVCVQTHPTGPAALESPNTYSYWSTGWLQQTLFTASFFFSNNKKPFHWVTAFLRWSAYVFSI